MTTKKLTKSMFGGFHKEKLRRLVRPLSKSTKRLCFEVSLACNRRTKYEIKGYVVFY